MRCPSVPIWMSYDVLLRAQLVPTGSFSSTMSILRRRRSVVPPTFQYPIKLCAATTVTVYILSLITGNVSQVDRLWTFLPVIYSSYYAFLPWWPRKPLFFLFPYSPHGVDRRIMSEGNPRTLVMFVLQVSADCHSVSCVANSVSSSFG